MANIGERVRSKFNRIVLKNLRLIVVTKAVDLERKIETLIDNAYRVMWDSGSNGFAQNPFSAGQWAPLKKQKQDGSGFFFVTGDLQQYMTSKGLATATLGKPKVLVEVGKVQLKPQQVAAYFTSNGRSVIKATENNRVKIHVEPYTNLKGTEVAKGGTGRGVIEGKLFGHGIIFSKLTNSGRIGGVYRDLVPNFLAWYLKNRIKPEIRNVVRGS